MTRKKSELPPWVPYVVPMALFLGITIAESRAPSRYVELYFAKILIVTMALIWARPTWKDIKWEPKLVPFAVLAGLALFGAWIGIEKFFTYPHLGNRTAYNPFESISDTNTRQLFLIARFYGLALMVPFMEELFWRSFGLRYASQSDFKALPIGAFTVFGGILATAVFALSHPEWISAFVFGAAMALIVRQTRSVFACFIVHSVTNLALGIYVVNQGLWSLW